MTKRTVCILSLLLALIVCVTILAACSNTEKTLREIQEETIETFRSVATVTDVTYEEPATIKFSVPYETAELDFSKMDFSDVTYAAYADSEKTKPVTDKISLAVGENTYYLLLSIDDVSDFYTIHIVRKEHAVHAFGDWTTDFEPTCTAKGQRSRYCVCGAKETEAINELGHEIVPHAAKAQNCTEIGWNAYNTCSRCDYTTYVEIPADGHDYQDAITAPTCTEKGYTTHTCSRCNDTYKDTYVNQLGHNLTPHAAKAQNCTEIGWNAYDTCSRCDYTTYAEIPADGHAWDKGVALVRPSIETEGTLRTTCATCNLYYDETMAKLVPSKGLTFEAIENNYFVVTGIGTCTDTDLVIPSYHDGIVVKRIKTEAFKNCSQLKSVVIPNTVTTIEQNAFAGCASITSVVIGSSVTSIEDRAFLCAELDNDNLKTQSVLTEFINWNNTNTTFTVIDGNLYKNDGKTFMQYALGKKDASFTPPSTVDTINAYAFAYCANLQSVSLSDTVTCIENEAFRQCSALKTVSIPSTVLVIAENAFSDCQNLTYTEDDVAYYLGNKQNPHLVTIRVKDKKITKFTTHADTKIIYSFCFKDCFELQSVTITDKVVYIGKGAFSNCIVMDSIDIPNNVLRIDDRTFEFCEALSSVKIGNGVISVGDYAFRDCTALTSVDIPASLTEVASAMFYNCSALTSVSFPDTLVKIGTYAFNHCTELGYVILPASLKQIEASAFDNCTSIARVYYESDRLSWLKVRIDSKNESISNNDICFFSATTPDNNLYSYWHYDEQGEIENWQSSITLYGNGYLFDTEEDEIAITVLAKDETLYSFTPAQSGMVIIRSRGPVDTKGALYDSTHTLIDSDDDSGDAAGNFKIEHELTAGSTYYINVRPYSDGYNMNETTYIVLEGCGAAFPVKRDVFTTYPMKQSTYDLPELKKDGYTFLGWFSDEDCTKIVDNAYVITKDVETLYAGWEKNA